MPTTSVPPTPPRGRGRLQPVHIVLLALLGVVLAGALAFGARIGYSAAEGEPGEQPAARTTQQEAQARARGAGPDGANASQDAYVSQNQSQPPRER